MPERNALSRSHAPLRWRRSSRSFKYLKRLREDDEAKWDVLVIPSAAREGHLECLRYLHKTGVRGTLGRVKTPRDTGDASACGICMKMGVPVGIPSGGFRRAHGVPGIRTQTNVGVRGATTFTTTPRSELRVFMIARRNTVCSYSQTVVEKKRCLRH